MIKILSRYVSSEKIEIILVILSDGKLEMLVKFDVRHPSDFIQWV